MNQIKTILLTGATSGIGLEMARLLAARGHRLILASRSADRLEVVADELRRAEAAQVLVCPIDLSSPQAAEQLFAFTEALQLQIDVLINNAGFGILEEHVAINPERLRRMLQLNVIAVAELCQRYGAEMKRRRQGSILNVASTAAFQPTPYFAAYGASKSFVLCFSEALAKELEDYGVNVGCLAPGPTDTAFFDGIDPRRIAGGHLFRKAGRTDPRDVAAAGVELLEHGGMTKVVGLTNQLAILGNRLTPRGVVAAVSKRLIKPKALDTA